MEIKRTNPLTMLLVISLTTISMARDLGSIHCIGDSLTDGAGCSAGEGGYRHPLDRDLAAAGITHQWVGTLDTWPGGSWVGGFHDGHGGWSTTDLTYGNPNNPGAGSAPQWVSTFHPKTIIYMSGRNDPWEWFYGNTGWHDPYSTIISDLFANDPGVQIFWINPFMPRDWNYWDDQRCQMQDRAVRQVIAEQRLLGHQIYYIDAYRRLNAVPSDYSDAVHLDDSGYQKLERVIFQAILRTPQNIGRGQQVYPFDWHQWP